MLILFYANVQIELSILCIHIAYGPDKRPRIKCFSVKSFGVACLEELSTDTLLIGRCALYGQNNTVPLLH